MSNSEFYKTESGVVLFPEVLGRMSTRLAEAHINVLETVHAAWKKQVHYGFYPVDMTQEEFDREATVNPLLTENNRLVRRRGRAEYHRLTAVTYRSKKGGFKSNFDDIADAIEELGREASSLEDGDLARQESEIVARGFRTGDTNRAVKEWINLRQLPEFSMWAGLLDRRDSLKFDLQAFGTHVNPKVSNAYTLWGYKLLNKRGRIVQHSTVVGDSIGQAGLASVRVWSGNTLPSQKVPWSIGYKSMYWDNVSEVKAKQDVIPVLEQIIPEEKYKPGWLTKARQAIIVAHELGHAEHLIPEGTVHRLGLWYQPLKEAYGDAFDLWAISQYGNGILPNRDAQVMAIYYDIARALVQIKNHEQTSAKGDVSAAVDNLYVNSSYAKLYFLISKGILSFNSIGKYCLVDDLDKIKKSTTQYLKQVASLTSEADSTEVEDYFMARRVSPSRIYEGNIAA